MQSRNKREGRYIGHAYGQAVRWPSNLFRTVRAAKARAVLGRYSPKQLGWSLRRTISILFKRKNSRR